MCWAAARWGASCCSAWHGREHRGARMLHSAIIARIFPRGGDACLLPHDGDVMASLPAGVDEQRRQGGASSSTSSSRSPPHWAAMREEGRASGASAWQHGDGIWRDQGDWGAGRREPTAIAKNCVPFLLGPAAPAPMERDITGWRKSCAAGRIKTPNMAMGPR
jgi:hypothetical protein